ncbi:MAG: aminotransferase [Epulopiscium sp. Nuni2H_MBin003]|nr:MAG: aminotransferase [Epulopiscium sp. Nuni2H_MBin003]
MYDFDAVINRNNTGAVKTDANLIKKVLDLNYYEDSITMWVADMDFACAPQIVDALHKRVDKLIFGYTMPTDEYYQSIINWYERKHNMKIKKEWLVYSLGTVSAIRNCLRAFTNEGDGVIIQPPVYYPFRREVLETNRKVIYNELVTDMDNNYKIDFDGFEEKCADPNTKMFIYCNPHNPVGKIWSKAETTQILEICNQHDVIVFSDEIHCDLIRCGESFTSALNLPNNDNIIVATAANKTFNLAGLHSTNLVIKSPKLRRLLNEYTGLINISPLTMEATIAAYNQCESWVVEVNAVIDKNIEFIDNFIKKKLPKIKFVKPQGTYLVWLNFSQYGIDITQLLEIISEESHVILENGALFGECGKNFIRVNVACPYSVVVAVMNRLYLLLGIKLQK